MRIRVIGIGSDFGDDAAGLRVAERLAGQELPDGVSASCCARPFPDLLDPLADAQRVILIDALRSGRTPGSVFALSRRDLARRAPTSSHGVGVARVLELAERLRGEPLELEIFGIEADPAATGEISAAVEEGIARACAIVRARLEQSVGTS